jgi:hypothetical protein
VPFLDCFHCGNCLITSGHLPAVLALLDALAERRSRLSEAEWWRRYGSAWAAIRHSPSTNHAGAESFSPSLEGRALDTGQLARLALDLKLAWRKQHPVTLRSAT